MSPSTTIRLALPASAADRNRFLALAGSAAVAVALALAALHLARLPTDGAASQAGLARQVGEAGLRPGVVAAVLLLLPPVVVFAIQVLRVGSMARDRSMASLCLAGATPREVRAIAATEAAGAVAVGGLLAAPVYMALWLLAGVLPAYGARLLDTPSALDAIAWAGLVALAALAGALMGAAIRPRVLAEPLAVRHRGSPPDPSRAGAAVLIAAVGLIVAGAASWPLNGGEAAYAGLAAVVIGLLLAAFAGGARLTLRCARLLGRCRGTAALLASRRLRADPGPAGRVASVLLVCGVVLGIEASILVDWDFGNDAAFYVTGLGLAALAVLVAVGVALLTLLVGAVDGLIDARRPLAALAAHGVDEAMLVRALALELSVAVVPAGALGALAGGPAAVLLAELDGAGSQDAGGMMLAGGVMTLATGLMLAAAAQVAARLLRPLVRTALDPRNLRAA